MTTDPPEIGLLVYPGCQLAAIHGLTDAFAVADRLARDRCGIATPLLHVSHYRFDNASGRPTRVFTTVPEAGEAAGEFSPMVIIAPPRLGDPPDAALAAPISPWLRERHAAGATIAAVCAGTFLVAEAGLLDGRPATTHWIYASHLRKSFPAVQLEIEKLLVDDGDILTAGGVMAWTDLSLRIIERLIGRAAMMEAARFLLIDPYGREQRSYSSFMPETSHGDAAVLKAQAWLEGEAGRKPSIEAMANAAGLSGRTFIRRFLKATGYRPTAYVQHLRIERARDLLVNTKQNVDQIAWEVGYDDASAFRSIFARETGLSPQIYRRKFAGSAAMALVRGSDVWHRGRMG